MTDPRISITQKAGCLVDFDIELVGGTNYVVKYKLVDDAVFTEYANKMTTSQYVKIKLLLPEGEYDVVVELRRRGEVIASDAIVFTNIPTKSEYTSVTSSKSSCSVPPKEASCKTEKPSPCVQDQIDAAVAKAVAELMLSPEFPASGRPGTDGEHGVDGVDGEHGNEGLQGARGERGERGCPGERGERGQAGREFVVYNRDFDNSTPVSHLSGGTRENTFTAFRTTATGVPGSLTKTFHLPPVSERENEVMIINLFTIAHSSSAYTPAEIEAFKITVVVPEANHVFEAGNIHLVTTTSMTFSLGINIKFQGVKLADGTRVWRVRP